MDTGACPAAGGSGAKGVPGEADACQGCPGAAFCKQTASASQETMESLQLPRLRGVKRTVLVLSGKGGVGKTSVSALLALAFTRQKSGSYGSSDSAPAAVAILDADLCGPSQHLVMGVRGKPVASRAEGWVPPVGPDAPETSTIFAVKEKVQVAPEDDLRGQLVSQAGGKIGGGGHCVATLSIGNLLPAQDTAVVWRGPRKTHMLIRMLRDTAWGRRDWLVVDTPPGTSDEHLAVVQTLKAEADPHGAVLVTTPQQVSLQTVRKELSFCSKMGIRVLGLVENMHSVICPCCDEEQELFAPVAGDGPSAAEELAREAGVPFLGRVPLDTRVTEALDRGECVLCSLPDSPTVVALQNIADRLAQDAERETRPPGGSV
jgi:Mrp family chromosome partitioning ATPase